MLRGVGCSQETIVVSMKEPQLVRCLGAALDDTVLEIGKAG